MIGHDAPPDAWYEYRAALHAASIACFALTVASLWFSFKMFRGIKP